MLPFPQPCKATRTAADRVSDPRSVVSRSAGVVLLVFVLVSIGGGLALGAVPGKSPSHGVSDVHLAGVTLDAQVAALRRSGGWRTVGRTVARTSDRDMTGCAASASSRLDLTALASSAVLSYRNSLELRLWDYVYSSAAAAKRALRSLGGRGAEACFEKVVVAEIPRAYPVGAVDVIGPKSVRAGDEARAAAVIIPFTYKGRIVRNYQDYVYARKGRVIVEIDTSADAGTNSYDVKTDRGITQLASTERLAHSTVAQPRQPIGTSLALRVSRDLPQRCERQAAHKARLDAPIIYRRASYIAVLLVDKGDNYTLFCSWEPNPSLPPSDQNQFATTDEQPAVPARHSFEGIEAAPPAIGIQDRQGGDQICDSPPSPNLGEMYGFAGSDVVGATFRFAHQPPITAVVERGFYIASWPYASWPNSVSLKTTFGTTVIRHVPKRGC
jgi:hypothetical protein